MAGRGGARPNTGPDFKYAHWGQQKPTYSVRIPGDITPLEVEQWIVQKLQEKYGKN